MRIIDFTIIVDGRVIPCTIDKDQFASLERRARKLALTEPVLIERPVKQSSIEGLCQLKNN